MIVRPGPAVEADALKLTFSLTAGAAGENVKLGVGRLLSYLPLFFFFFFLDRHGLRSRALLADVVGHRECDIVRAGHAKVVSHGDSALCPPLAEVPAVTDNRATNGRARRVSREVDTLIDGWRGRENANTAVGDAVVLTGTVCVVDADRPRSFVTVSVTL